MLPKQGIAATSRKPGHNAHGSKASSLFNDWLDDGIKKNVFRNDQLSFLQPSSTNSKNS